MFGLSTRARRAAHFLRPGVIRNWYRYKPRFVAARFQGRRGSLHFAPDTPSEGFVIWKVAQLLGLRIVRRRQRDARATVLWRNATVIAPLVGDAHPVVLNAACLDISKRRVDDAMLRVFGYAARVDPAAWQGVCVRKSDENGTHDGEIVTCPVTSTDPDSVYQRLVDNTISVSEVQDLRVVVVGSAVPVVYAKRRPVSDRFSNTNTTVRLVAPLDVFSAVELDLVARFASEVGLDLGELDALRDRTDGRIYIVDVNPTPCGPPNHLPERAGAAALAAVAEALDQLLCDRTAEPAR
jgi:hypothetical protein